VRTGLQKVPGTKLIMTVFAFEIVYFVKYISQSFVLCSLVTFVACHILVLSIQWETSFIVIKSGSGLELCKFMTSGTISQPVDLKLFHVNIIMAV